MLNVFDALGGNAEQKAWLAQPGLLHQQYGRVSMHIVQDPMQAALAKSLGELDQLIAAGELKKDSRFTMAALFEIDHTRVFAKSVDYAHAKFHHTLRYYFTPARSYWYAIIAQKVAQAGFHTPKVLAAGEERNGRKLLKSYLVTQALNDVTDCRDLIYHRSDIAGQELLWLERFAKTLKKFHNAGLTHGDIQLVNMYLHPTDSGDEIGIWDLDSALYFKNGAPQKRLLRDVGRLISSFLYAVDANPAADHASLSVSLINERFCNAYGIDAKLVAERLENYWLKNTPLKNIKN